MRALIVDDSPAARLTALTALEDALDELGVNAEVLEAENGVEALRLLAAHRADILLVDLHMPDVHGLEVLAFWKQRLGNGQGLALVVSTATSERDRQKALETGAKAFIEKPVSTEVLVKHLEALAGAGT